MCVCGTRRFIHTISNAQRDRAKVKRETLSLKELLRVKEEEIEEAEGEDEDRKC